MTPTPLDSHVCAGALPLRLWEQACPTHRLVERFRSSNHIARTVGWAKARSSRRAHLERPKVGTLRFAHPTDRFHGIELRSASNFIGDIKTKMLQRKRTK